MRGVLELLGLALHYFAKGCDTRETMMPSESGSKSPTRRRRLRGISAWLSAATLLWVSLPSAAFALTATHLCGESDDPCEFSGDAEAIDGDVLDFGARTFRMVAGATLSAGSLVIRAASFELEPGATITAAPNSTVEIDISETCLVAGTISLDNRNLVNDGGDLVLRCGTIRLERSHEISAGSITFDAMNSLMLDGDPAIDVGVARLTTPSVADGTLTIGTDLPVYLGTQSIVIGTLILNGSFPDFELSEIKVEVLDEPSTDADSNGGCHLAQSHSNLYATLFLFIPILVLRLSKRARAFGVHHGIPNCRLLATQTQVQRQNI